MDHERIVAAHLEREDLPRRFCKMAVEAHGGKIWVESEGEGKGATFAVALPC